MYGTVARMRLKPGVDPATIHLDSAPEELGEVLYRMDTEPDICYLAVFFESKEAYFANAASPEQAVRYQTFRAFLAEDPEWHDGEIVQSIFPPQN